MTLNLALNTAITGLGTAQAELNLISNNIANVNTEGYTRKVAEQQSLVLAGQGAGVQLGDIQSDVDQNLLENIRNVNGTAAQLQSLDGYFTQIQDTFGTTASQNSISNIINNLGQAFTSLSTDPTTATTQLQAVQAGQQVASAVANSSATIQNLRLDADREIGQTMQTINSTLQDISSLNDQISVNTATNRPTADLEDKRDTDLNNLSNLIDIRYFQNSNGTVTVYTSDGTTLVDSSAQPVSHTALSQVTASDSYAGGDFNGIYIGTTDVTSSIRSGKLKALINMRDDTLPDMQAQVDQLAQGLATQVNQVSNRGTSYPSMVNSVTGTTQFLDPSNETMTVSSGQPKVVLYDANGNEVSSSAILDPAGINFTNGGTLSSLASQVQTWVQAQDPQLANASVAFNAQGQLSINLGTDSFGVAFIDEQNSGKGSGQQDASIGLDIDGDGTIDQTTSGFSNFLGLNDFFTTSPNLTQWDSSFKPTSYALGIPASQTLNFYDSTNPTSGAPIGSVTVNPNETLQQIASDINASAGLQGRISAAVVPEAGGERLQIKSLVGSQIAITQTGGTNAITTLGLAPTDDGFSQGLAVNQTLVDDPSLIARGQVQIDPATGKYLVATGDNTTATQLSTLMTSQVPLQAAGSLPAGNITLADYAASIVSNASTLQANNKTAMQQQTDLQTSLNTQEAQLTGVNLDQEMSQLLVYQQTYAASAKVISTTQQLFTILNNLIQ